MGASSLLLVLVLSAEPALEEEEPLAAPARVEAASTTGVELSNQEEGPLIFTLALHGRVDGERSWGRFTARARGSVLATGIANASGLFPPVLFRDLGSFAALEYRVAEDTTVSWTVLPLASRVLRVGFDFANDWGAPLFGTQGAPEPAMVFAVRHPRFDGFVGGRLVMDSSADMVRSSVLAGGGVALPANFRVDVRGQVLIDTNALRETQDLRQDLVRVIGVARLQWRLGQAVGTPFDLQTYRADPQRFERFFAPLPAVGASGLELSFEGGVANEQKLKDPPVFAQLQASAMGGRARVTLTGRLRTAAQLTFDEPVVANTTPVAPNLVFMASADFRLGPLAPGLAFYAMTPAWEDLVTGNLGLMYAFSGPESRIWVRSTMGYRPSSRWGAKVLLRLDAGTHFTLLGQLDVDLEPTRLAAQIDPPDGGVMFTSQPVSLGGQLYAQLRF